MSTDKQELYRYFVESIQKVYNVSESENEVENLFKSKSTREVEDIVFLWSLATDDIKNIIKNEKYNKSDKNIGLNINLKYNILHEFLRLIKVPSVLEKMHQLFEIAEDREIHSALSYNNNVGTAKTAKAYSDLANIGVINMANSSENSEVISDDDSGLSGGAKLRNSYIDAFKKVYTDFLDYNSRKISGDNDTMTAALKKWEISQDDNENGYPYSFLQFITINSHQEEIYNQPMIEVLSLVLFNLYLECAIYQYEKMYKWSVLCRELTYKLGTTKYSDYNAFKHDISTWATYRFKLNEIITNNISASNVNVFNKDVIHDNTYEYVDLTSLYQQVDYQKLRHLSKCRHELVTAKQHTLNKFVAENISWNDFLSKVDNVFKTGKFYLTDNNGDDNFNDNPTTVRYNILQTIHAYEQIINTMISERRQYLNNLRQYQINDNSFGKIDDIYKYIITFRQFINHPFTFQYKVTDYRQCYHLMNENTMKVIFEKWLKISIVIDYCKKNEIPLTHDTAPDDHMTELLSTILSTNVPMQHAALNDNNRRITMQRILKNINKAKVELSSFKLNTGDLSSEIKDITIRILKSFKQKPFDILSSTPQNIYDTYNHQKYNAVLIQLGQLIRDYHHSNVLATISNAPRAASPNYYDTKISSHVDIINKTIANHAEIVSRLLNIHKEMKESFDKFIISLMNYQTAIQKIRKYIDSASDENWTKSYVESGSMDGNDYFDYNLVAEKKTKSTSALMDLNFGISNLCMYITTVLQNYKRTFGEIKAVTKSLEDIGRDINMQCSNLETGLRAEESKHTKRGNDLAQIHAEITRRNDVIETELSQNTSQNQDDLITERDANREKLININADIYEVKGIKNCIEQLLNGDIVNNMNVYDKLFRILRATQEVYMSADFNYHKIYLYPDNNTEPFFASNIKERLKYEFSLIQKFIAIIRRSEGEKDDVPQNYELHRIKLGLMQLDEICYQNTPFVRHGIPGVVAEYDMNNMSNSLEMVFGELFREKVRGEQLGYEGLDNPDKPLDNPNPALINNDIRCETYEKMRENYMLYRPTEYNIKLFRNEQYTVDQITQKHLNVSVYQIIETLNNNPILTLLEKLYGHLLALNEVRPLPHIDVILEILRLPQYYEYGKITMNNIAPVAPTGASGQYSKPIINETDERFGVYMKKYLFGNGISNTSREVKLNKNTNAVRLLNFDNDMARYLYDNLGTVSSLDPNKFIMQSYDSNNRIHFNIGKLIKTLDEVDISKFIKVYYRIIRNQYVKIYPDTSVFASKKIPFEDIHFYNVSLIALYNDSFNIYPAGYFSLGNVAAGIKELVNFENPLNDIVVQILEMTNGTI
jgi:hypothetical protein